MEAIRPLNEKKRFMLVLVSGPFEGSRIDWAYEGGMAYWHRQVRYLLNPRISTYTWRPSSKYESWDSHSVGVTITREAEALLRDLNSHVMAHRVVFVAHSLGGLIVKDVLCQSSENPGRTKLAQQTAGVVFLGTPHWDTASDDYGSIKRSLDKICVEDTTLHQSRHLLWRSSNRQIDIEASSTGVLNEISTCFVKAVEEHGYQIYSFLEHESQGWGGTKAVSLQCLVSMFYDARSIHLKV